MLRVRALVVSGLPDHFLRIVAYIIARADGGNGRAAPGGRGQLHAVIHKGSHRTAAPDNHHVPTLLRQLGLSEPFSDIRENPAQVFRRGADLKPVPGLQKQILRLLQPLADGPVGGLPEIPALRVF